jgi:general secretion pathway protein G
MKNFKNAFTMVELVFVIVILGILAAVAVPRLAATRTDADITKGRADVASIRSSIISERQSRLIIGCSTYIPNGTGTYTCPGSTTLYDEMDKGSKLFAGVLMYPHANKSGSGGKWSAATVGSGSYKFWINSTTSVDFTYNATTGVFDCTHSDDNCKLLTE